MDYIIKTIYRCNLSCIYCFEQSHNRLNQSMSLDNATQFVQKVYEYYIHNNPEEILAFHWHGGEPMLLDARFFEEIIKFQRRVLGTRIRWFNSLQSNLTLLNDDFIELFKEYKSQISLGISFDFFGSDRVDKNNKSINARVSKNIKRLEAAGIQTNFLTMITKGNVAHLDKIYDLLRSQNISIRFNQIFGAPKQRAFNRPESVRLRNTQYSKALQQFTYRWLHDKDAQFMIDNAFHVIKKIIDPDATRMCWYEKNCFDNHMMIFPDGTVFPCDSLHFKDFSYGNIFHDSYEKILTSKPRKRLLKDHKKAPKECQGCKFLNYCNGGCPMRSIFTMAKTKARLGKDPLCKMHYDMFEMIGQHLVETGKIDPDWADS